MSETLVVRQGWFPPLRSLFFAVLCGGGGYLVSRPDPADGMVEADWTLAWLGGGIALLFVCAALHALWLIARRVPVAVLSPQGVRARACDDVLIPWDMVKSVSLGTASAVAAPAASAAAPLVEAASRHDTYTVVLDPKVLDLGIKRSESLISIGFKLVPLHLRVSSPDLAEAFRRFLPAERCVGFANSAAPSAMADLAARGAFAVGAVAVGTLERMELDNTAVTPDGAVSGADGAGD